MTKQEYIESIAFLVQKYAPQYGILVCSPIIAQAFVEGWNSQKDALSVLADKYHNYHGMKCGSKWTGKSVNLTTKEEYQPGVLMKIKDHFRVFDSMEEGVKGYFEFIQIPRYQNLRGITDPKEYLETIKADGYATASGYVQTNMKIIDQYGLTKYDRRAEENMAVKIGHASIDERKKIKGGAAGDQTGGEVCTRTWYSKPWGFVLRPRSSSLAEWSARACEDACANKNIGYDQNQRNTLYTQALKVGFDLSKITVPCECDCSSLMHVCALAGGANITYGSNGAATSTMKERFTVNGEYEVLTDKKYLTSDKYLKRGDILVKAGSHTVMVLENGVNASTNTSTTYSLTDFVKEVQRAIGAEVDGIAGAETLSKTVTVSATKNRKHAVVKPIQKRLNALGYNCGTADGIAGAKFKAAVKAFQKANGCTQDGEITARNRTWKKLLGMM